MNYTKNTIRTQSTMLEMEITLYFTLWNIYIYIGLYRSVKYTKHSKLHDVFFIFYLVKSLFLMHCFPPLCPPIKCGPWSEEVFRYIRVKMFVLYTVHGESPQRAYDVSGPPEFSCDRTRATHSSRLGQRHYLHIMVKINKGVGG